MLCQYDYVDTLGRSLYFLHMARPKGDINRTQTGFRLRPEIVKVVRHLAIDRGCSPNLIVEEALESYLHQLGVEIPPPESPEE